MEGHSPRKIEIYELNRKTNFTKIILKQWKAQIDNKFRISLRGEIFKKCERWARLNGTPFLVEKLEDAEIPRKTVRFTQTDVPIIVSIDAQGQNITNSGNTKSISQLRDPFKKEETHEIARSSISSLK